MTERNIDELKFDKKSSVDAWAAAAEAREVSQKMAWYTVQKLFNKFNKLQKDLEADLWKAFWESKDDCDAVWQTALKQIKNDCDAACGNAWHAAQQQMKNDWLAAYFAGASIVSLFGSLEKWEEKKWGEELQKWQEKYFFKFDEAKKLFKNFL